MKWDYDETNMDKPSANWCRISCIHEYVLTYRLMKYNSGCMCCQRYRHGRDPPSSVVSSTRHQVCLRKAGPGQPSPNPTPASTCMSRVSCKGSRTGFDHVAENWEVYAVHVIGKLWNPWPRPRQRKRTDMSWKSWKVVVDLIWRCLF